jgi:hypothetical protein
MTQSQYFTKVGYGPQASAYATEASSYVQLARVQAADITSEQNFIYDRGLGEGLNASNTYYGPYNARGFVEFFVVDFDILKHWVGHKTGSGTSGSKYTLTEATSIQATSAGVGIMQPFSIEMFNNDTESLGQFAVGAVGTRFTLSAGINERLRCRAEFIARSSGHRESGESYTANTDPSYVMIGANYKWGTTPTAFTGLQSFTLEYINGIVGEGDETRSIESRFRDIPHFGGNGRQYKFSLVIKMAQALSDTLIKNHYGLESPTNTFVPETGSVSISPTADLEFEINLVNGSRLATLQVDQCSIDTISVGKQLGNGLVLLNVNGTARLGRSNTPILWWET